MCLIYGGTVSVLSVSEFRCFDSRFNEHIRHCHSVQDADETRPTLRSLGRISAAAAEEISGNIGAFLLNVGQTLELPLTELMAAGRRAIGMSDDDSIGAAILVSFL